LLEKDGNAWLENLWVMPAQIGHSIGSALFKHALHLSKQHGYQILRLESDPNAVGFYIKMGAYKIDQRHYDMEGTSRILTVMELKL
jgi:ribosomal protein S18 acetylase RimI-like enzyme